MSNEFPYYTVTEAAAKARESYNTIRRRIDAGVMKTLNTAAGILIEKSELERYLATRGSKSISGRSYYRSAHFATNEVKGVENEPQEK